MFLAAKMKSSKNRTENNKGITDHMLTLHQRLYHALNLGFSRSNNEKEKKWHSNDIEIQKLVTRSILAFIDCLSPETSNLPLVKDSVPDIVRALRGILQHKNGTLLPITANVALKLVSTLPRSILQLHVLDLVHPLSSLLSSHQLQVAMACASTLNVILSNLSNKREKEIWEILKEREIVSLIVTSLHNFFEESKPTEYFQEMASLLSIIMMRWPRSRRLVWIDAKFMEVLGTASSNTDFSTKVTTAKVYSALALCYHGAKSILEKEESVLLVMVHCMDCSQPHSVRMVGIKLAQHLARNEQGCLRMMSLCCGPIVRSIINGMKRTSLQSGKMANRELSLLVEACRLALVTRWGGEHHIHFWKSGIVKILLDLLIVDLKVIQHSQYLSLKEQIFMVKEALDQNLFLDLRPYVWEILGWLAAHSGEDFCPDLYADDFSINIIIICACLDFTGSSREGRQLHLSYAFSDEAASRAVLMMVYSRCKYFATKVRFVLSEVLNPRGMDHLKYLLANLNFKSLHNQFETLDLRQCVINLMGLACYSGLSQYRKPVIKHEGIKILSVLMNWCLSNRANLERTSVSTQLYNKLDEQICCWDLNDWEGKDSLLLYCLLGLAELINNTADSYSTQLDCTESQFIHKLQEICIDTYAPGPKWYAAYILSFFGIYGFPSKLGKKIGRAFTEKEYTDFELVLSSGKSFNVHAVILKFRCPALLPPEGQNSKFKKDARLSSHVGDEELVKLLEYVYLGYVQAGEEIVKKLKTFAKRCNLRSLVEMISRKIPQWGSHVPIYDFIHALDPNRELFWDLILEVNASEFLSWNCNICSLLTPHVHVHKVILSASSDYLRAMFRSGMQESNSNLVKVAISWEALMKLANWFYSNELPKPPSGCLWENMDPDKKLRELIPYIELCSLAEFWLLEEIQEGCSKIIVSCMNSTRHLSVKIIEIAAKYSQWQLAEIAANYMAPIYRQLCDSGELEDLDEELVDLARAASVRLSQQAGDKFSSL